MSSINGGLVGKIFSAAVGEQDVWAVDSRHLFIVAPCPASGIELAAALGIKKYSSKNPHNQRHLEGLLRDSLLRKDLIQALSNQNILLHWVDTASGVIRTDLHDSLGHDVIAAGTRELNSTYFRSSCTRVIDFATILPR